MMVPMAVSHLSLSGAGFALVFRTTNGHRLLPVGLSLAEAQAFLQPQSPAHELTKRFMDMLECRVELVELRELRNGVAICRILTRLPSGGEAAMDARVGDAVALAIRAHAPIFVDDALIEKIGHVAGEKERPQYAEAVGDDMPVPPAADMETIAEVRQRLNHAVELEHYEEAAKLRDEVRRLIKK